ncbi:hypothetical protein NUU61_006692 [Penicillium alfredii]|uniref:Uncharacterized protein n=1 Tax=Penicillium alfredii TaxID=1506179 RepID=A0A9W9F1F3_9EURO|nr:uncharacterized protein NUU61_006692 [Penicillium alfredii]KAJ5091822.1 hypothetical protein NUU61_006692 [Penicillium alfredii]
MCSQYGQFVLDGGASDFITKLKADDNFVDNEGSTWNAAQEETFLYNLARGFYKTEVEVYDILNDPQSKGIPRLFACVTMRDSLFLPQPASISEYFEIPGILLQYIKGFPLTESLLMLHARAGSRSAKKPF